VITPPDEVVRTSDDVQAWLEAIAALANDDEVAHSSEDELHRAVLRAIADGSAEQPVRMAELALRTEAIEFSRWCA
jgi:hypothetical protein